MKRCTLILTLLLLVGLAFGASAAEETAEAAVAEERISAAPTGEAEATEAAAEESSVTEPALLLDVGVPASSEQTCTAELDCEDGNVLSCTGSYSCKVNHFYGYVECDGQRTTCPNFCEARKRLLCGSCGEYFCSCTSLSGDCQVSSGGVTCDGNFNPCLCPFGCY